MSFVMTYCNDTGVTCCGFAQLARMGGRARLFATSAIIPEEQPVAGRDHRRVRSERERCMEEWSSQVKARVRPSPNCDPFQSTNRHNLDKTVRSDDRAIFGIVKSDIGKLPFTQGPFVCLLALSIEHAKNIRARRRSSGENHGNTSFMSAEGYLNGRECVTGIVVTNKFLDKIRRVISDNDMAIRLSTGH